MSHFRCPPCILMLSCLTSAILPLDLSAQSLAESEVLAVQLAPLLSVVFVPLLPRYNPRLPQSSASSILLFVLSKSSLISASFSLFSFLNSLSSFEYFLQANFPSVLTFQLAVDSVSPIFSPTSLILTTWEFLLSCPCLPCPSLSYLPL